MFGRMKSIFRHSSVGGEAVSSALQAQQWAGLYEFQVSTLALDEAIERFDSPVQQAMDAVRRYNEAKGVLPLE